jgi:MYXO-CTERM domain-containing protein
VVKVVDSLNNTATVMIKIGAGLSLSPPSASVQAGAAIMFGVMGGSGMGYAWSLAANGSGSTVDASTGAYLAGALGGTDVVHVVDSLGNSAEATVTVAAQALGDGGLSGDGLSGDGTSGSGVHAGCGCEVGAADRAARSILVALILFGCVLMRTRRRA